MNVLWSNIRMRLLWMRMYESTAANPSATLYARLHAVFGRLDCGMRAS